MSDSLAAQHPGIFHRMAAEVADLTETKNKAYGNQAPAVLRALYPRGISVEQLDEALWVARCVDKLCRIANGAGGSLGEDAWRDLMGYALRVLADRATPQPAAPAPARIKWCEPNPTPGF